MDRGRDVACTAVSASLALLCLILLLAIDGLSTAGAIVLLVSTFGFSIIVVVWGVDLLKPGIWDAWAAFEDEQRLRANRAAPAHTSDVQVPGNATGGATPSLPRDRTQARSGQCV